MVKSQKIIIIDYGMGNLRSVLKKLEQFKVIVSISSDLSEISKADKLVLPGVGHFESGVKNLKQSGIWEILNQKVLDEKTPFLGICLGMQLMAKFSEEGNTEGLGWFDAEVKRFNVSDKLKYKVPHMGWNNTVVKKDSILYNQVSEEAMFYFVHSYYFKCNNQADILTSTEYDAVFTSAIEKNNMFGTQFHPEKSHDWGKKLISNFIELI